MNFTNPVIVYDGESGLDAGQIQAFLKHHDVESEVVVGHSEGDTLFGGSAGPMPSPQIWVEEASFAAARVLVEEFEQMAIEQRKLDQARAADADPISVECEKCEKVTVFPAVLFGTVQVCPKCQSFVDVGEDDAFDDWQIDGEEM